MTTRKTAQGNTRPQTPPILHQSSNVDAYVPASNRSGSQKELCGYFRAAGANGKVKTGSAHIRIDTQKKSPLQSPEYSSASPSNKGSRNTGRIKTVLEAAMAYAGTCSEAKTAYTSPEAINRYLTPKRRFPSDFEVKMARSENRSKNPFECQEKFNVAKKQYKLDRKC